METPEDFKPGCGFRKLNLCMFRASQCNHEDCSMYGLEFSSNAIKARIKELKAEIKAFQDKLNYKKTKELLKKEEQDKDDSEVLQFKKDLYKLKDLDAGIEILKKAYVYCKRVGK